MFGKLLNKARELGGAAHAQLTKVDDLRRFALAAAGAMAADGKMESKEFDIAARVGEARFPVFRRPQIEAALTDAVKVYEGGRFSAKRQTMAQLAQVETPEEAEAIAAAVLDICDQGGIGEDEMPYIEEVFAALRVDLKKYL